MKRSRTSIEMIAVPWAAAEIVLQIAVAGAADRAAVVVAAGAAVDAEVRDAVVMVAVVGAAADRGTRT